MKSLMVISFVFESYMPLCLFFQYPMSVKIEVSRDFWRDYVTRSAGLLVLNWLVCMWMSEINIDVTMIYAVRIVMISRKTYRTFSYICQWLVIISSVKMCFCSYIPYLFKVLLVELHSSKTMPIWKLSHIWFSDV